MFSSNAQWYSAAVGFLLLLATLFFVWTMTPVLSWIIAPTHLLPSRLWTGWLIAFVVLLAATAYLHEPSLLWQVPLQAGAFAFLVSGVAGLVLGHAYLAVRSAAICLGYIAVAAVLGLWMRNLQGHFLKRRRRPPNNRWRGP